MQVIIRLLKTVQNMVTQVWCNAEDIQFTCKALAMKKQGKR